MASPSRNTMHSASSFNASASVSSPGQRTGIKKEVDELYGRIQEHDDAIARLDAIVEKNANVADDSIKSAQASLKASISSLRDEMSRKMTSLVVEIAQLQKAVNIQRGEQSILAQQQKDTARRLEGIAVTVSDIVSEVRGEDAMPQ